MYERILVPLDGSRLSEAVLPYASGMAAAHQIELVFVAIVGNISTRTGLQNRVEELAATHGASTLFIPERLTVAGDIIEEARRKPKTLVAMTSRGHSGIAELALGSVAQQVLRQIHDTIFLFHPAGRANTAERTVEIRKVVLPIANDLPVDAMAQEAARFAAWTGATLEVVSAIGAVPAEVDGASLTAMEPAYVRSTANALAKAHGISATWDSLGGRPEDAIVEHVAHQPYTVLAMMTRRAGALQAALLGSVTGACLRRAGVPILVRAP